MRILLTGASGCLGRNFVLRAPEAWQITALYSTDTSFPEFICKSGKKNISPTRCDLSDGQQVTALFGGQGQEWDCCLHLACKVDIPWSVREPWQDLQTNVGSLLNLLRHIRAAQFIYMSSGAVYGNLRGEVHPGLLVNPTLPYAISKLACERYVRSYCERYCTLGGFMIVRFFGVYGPYEAPHKIYGKLVRTFGLERQHSFTLYGPGDNLVDAMYVEDAIDALQRMVSQPCRNEIIDLPGGDPMTVETLALRVARALGCGPVHIEKQGLAHESNRFWASPRRARELYGFQPKLSLEQGVMRFREFLSSSQQ